MARESWNYEKCYGFAKQCTCESELMKKFPKAYAAAKRNKWLKDFTWFKRPDGHHTPWTEDECYEEAKKYKSRSEFQHNAKGAYKAARKHGWIEDYVWLKRPEAYNQLWNRETCEAEARKYTSLKDFRENCNSAFDAAYNHGWIKEFDWLEKKEPIWTYDTCFEEAKNYNSRKEFQVGSPGAYGKSWKNGWLDDYVWFKRPENYNKKWNRETCFEEAKKYTCRVELCHGTPGAYNVALSNGWLDDYTWFQKPENYNKKWNYETCLEEAKKYTKIIDFMKGSFGAYDVARVNGWMKDYMWIERQLKDWTYENCYEEAKKYGCKCEFEKGCSPAYQSARRNGWLCEYIWFERPEVYNKMWYKDDCLEVAKKYNCLRDFMKNDRSAYTAARNNGWIKDITWFKRAIPEGFDDTVTNYIVYVYQDDELNVAYIGLTNNLKRRHADHKRNRDNRDTLGRFYIEKDLPVPEPIILEENLGVEEAQFYEGFYVDKYREDGWNVLNKAKTGIGKSSICGGHIKYTHEKSIEIAKKYEYFEDFRKNDIGCYNRSRKMGWLDEFTWLKRKTTPPQFWTKEKILEEAKKYLFLQDFKKYSNGAYSAALRLEYIDEFDWLKTKPSKVSKFTDEEIIEKSKEYKTLEEFITQSGMYNAACHRKLVTSMTWLKRKEYHRQWTVDEIIEESKKYKTLKDFRTKSVAAYYAAQRAGIINNLVWLDREVKRDVYWTKERIFEESRKYETIKDFRKYSPKAYSAAKAKHLIEEMDWLKRQKNQFG